MISIGLSGCASLDERLQGAASQKAVAEAGVNLPDLPPACRQKMSRIAPQVGQKWRAVQLRWLTAADEQDARTGLCAGFYDNVRSRFSKQH